MSDDEGNVVDLTVEILREIRRDVKETRDEVRETRAELLETFRSELRQTRTELKDDVRALGARFETLEQETIRGFTAARAEFDKTNAHIMKTNARIDDTNARIDVTNGHLAHLIVASADRFRALERRRPRRPPPHR